MELLPLSGSLWRRRLYKRHPVEKSQSDVDFEPDSILWPRRSDSEGALYSFVFTQLRMFTHGSRAARLEQRGLNALLKGTVFIRCGGESELTAKSYWDTRLGSGRLSCQNRTCSALTHHENRYFCFLNKVRIYHWSRGATVMIQYLDLKTCITPLNRLLQVPYGTNSDHFSSFRSNWTWLHRWRKDQKYA